MADDYEEAGHFTLTIDSFRYHVPLYCPHRAGWLKFGNINSQRRTITCPLHYSVFCLETGRQLSGPPCDRLDVHVEAAHDRSKTSAPD